MIKCFPSLILLTERDTNTFLHYYILSEKIQCFVLSNILFILIIICQQSEIDVQEKEKF